MFSRPSFLRYEALVFPTRGKTVMLSFRLIGIGLNMVLPPGIEPGFQDPQSCVLSVERWKLKFSRVIQELVYLIIILAYSSTVRIMVAQFFLSPHLDISLNSYV